ncbi:homeobox-like domain superfamily [Holotrichia oblita]|uniref:Homeobox-like domain superfamily n=1 Tax=Holotrichia oblita TaxID=644536 RepID=A0ACB9ST74_HOLOL|nr:homeobox-like domain superfamily [Holotrichia oblita]
METYCDYDSVAMPRNKLSFRYETPVIAIVNDDKDGGPHDDYLSEIIKLQLKKPKRWNWELTTSRSSPHITLPVIQLYNAKGKLLVEAKESGSDRRSWHSNDWAKNDRNHVAQSNDPKPLQKCTSDILHQYRYGNNPLARCDLRKSSTIDLDKGKTSLGEYPVEDKSIGRDGLRKEHSLCYRHVKPEKNFDDESLRKEPKVNRNTNKYVKSKSAILLEKDSKDKDPAGLDSRRNYNKYVRSKTNTIPSILKKEGEDNLQNIRNKVLPKIVVDRPKCPMTQTKTGSFNFPTKHGRANHTGDNPITKSRSVLIKFAEDTKDNEKLLESYKINRSDDLYKRLLKYNEESIKRAINDGYKKFLNEDINKSGKIPERMKKEMVKVKTEVKPEVNRVKYSKYITRTCSAGTLVIKEESFSNSNLRRRRKTADSDQVDNTKVPNFSSLRRKELYPNKKNDITYPHMLTHINRDRSSERTDSLKLPAYNNLIHSRSDVSCATIGSKGCNYTVEEPSSLESRKNSEDIDKMPTCDGPRKSSRGQWSEDDLFKAADAVVIHKVPIRQAARENNIPERTLRFRLLKKNFAPTRKTNDFKEYNLAKSLGIARKVNEKNNMAGIGWLHLFLARNNRLSVRQAVSIDRAEGMNKAEIDTYFKLLTETLTENNLLNKPLNIFNMDESGLQLNNDPGKEIAVKGSKDVHVIKAQEIGETITIVACNAEGNF